MNIQRRFRTIGGLAMSLAMVTSVGVTAYAQDAGAADTPPAVTAGAQQASVEGLVVGRDGPNMLVKTVDSPRLTVILSDNTKATEKGGFLGLSRQHPDITALVPGLQVKVEGNYDPDHKLIAKKVTFSRNSLNTARQINAGLNPVAEQVAAAQDQMRSNRRDIDATQQDIDATKQGLAATNQITAQNTQGIGKANQRFTTLDQYETKSSVTVNFANGRATVRPDDKEQLVDFVKAAADTPGYMIQVQGYASAVGPTALNQRLSQERADAVLAIIQQSGVPLTRILAPAAMGTTDQVATNHTRSGQAQNRRVVVTVLVNKGIVGDQASL